MGNTYYNGIDYNIFKKDGWFLIIPTESMNNIGYIDTIANKTIFDLRKMAKKDILDYFNEINKMVTSINGIGLQDLKKIDVDELIKSERNNDSKKFDEILSKSLEQVHNIQKGLNVCNNQDKSIDKMFQIIISHVSDPDFLKWIKLNLNLCLSCETFSQVERIYNEQKNMVRNTILNDDPNEKKINLNEVSSMKQVELKEVPGSPFLPKQEHSANMTLNETGLSPSGVTPSNDTFVMDTTPSYDNNVININQGKVKKLVPPKNNGYNSEDLGNSAFTNWYGIILTLIFSFAIGYLIAWLFLKMR